jgi:hypothetical protein
MSNASTERGKVEAVSIRIYLQEGGRYLAICSVDRQRPADAPDQSPSAKPDSERHTGSSETTLGAALASVLQISGALEG